MSSKESNIKQLIQDYLLDEGLLRGKIPDPKLNFGFRFIYPPGKDPLGRHIGRNMVVIRPKNKNLIVVSLGVQISEPHIKALNSLENSKKMSFFMDLRKSFLLKDVFYRIDLKNHRFEITDQIFLNQDGFISKNSFYKSVRKVFNCAAYSNIILGEYCAGKIKPEDFMKSKEFTEDSNFSLYT
ncbi:MAG: DUF2299 domain-containing protein [Promethearchaeota archaeon]|nr:DUF2299 family protein [Candidatus Lokiarchaeota archaeon]TET60692.1 MAG: DUF2299 domain-containing protein [Candidatus Lokiarchaeota archaeon]